jgi:hypothetical protein
MRLRGRLLVVGGVFGRMSENNVFEGCRMCPEGGQDRLKFIVSIIYILSYEGRVVSRILGVLSMWLGTWLTQEISASINCVRYLAEAGAAKA